MSRSRLWPRSLRPRTGKRGVYSLARNEGCRVIAKPVTKKLLLLDGG